MRDTRLCPGGLHDQSPGRSLFQVKVRECGRGRDANRTGVREGGDIIISPRRLHVNRPAIVQPRAVKRDLWHIDRDARSNNQAIWLKNPCPVATAFENNSADPIQPRDTRSPGELPINIIRWSSMEMDCSIQSEVTSNAYGKGVSIKLLWKLCSTSVGII